MEELGYGAPGTGTAPWFALGTQPRSPGRAAGTAAPIPSGLELQGYKPEPAPKSPPPESREGFLRHRPRSEQIPKSRRGQSPSSAGCRECSDPRLPHGGAFRSAAFPSMRARVIKSRVLITAATGIKGRGPAVINGVSEGVERPRERQRLQSPSPARPSGSPALDVNHYRSPAPVPAAPQLLAVTLGSHRSQRSMGKAEPMEREEAPSLPGQPRSEPQPVTKASAAPAPADPPGARRSPPGSGGWEQGPRRRRGMSGIPALGKRAAGPSSWAALQEEN